MLNLSRIDELRDEVGADGLAEVLALFCEEVEELLAGLASLPMKDVPERLHFLKGSAFNIGMDEVGELCRAEESRLAAQPGSAPRFGPIREAYDIARSALAAVV